jgi:Arc/MetJ family transcription regulator
MSQYVKDRVATRETILIDDEVYRLCKSVASGRKLKLYEFINLTLAKAVRLRLSKEQLRHQAKVERDNRKAKVC